jgi:rfaE bifunctional protein nucleotidyltransferase chain/domain
LSHGVLGRESLIARCAAWRAAGDRIALTNGIFDVLHVGHLRYLEAARATADHLVVAVNSDASTTRLKGPSRPIMPEAERAELVAGLRCVDAVTIFDEPTAEPLVALLQPDVYVKGGDYSLAPDAAKPLPEAAIVQQYGGRVVLVPLVEGRSTTDVIATIVARHRER